MTPKDKGIQLIEIFKPHADWNNEYGSSEEKANLKHAKQCSIICVEQIIEANAMDGYGYGNVKNDYWYDVKKELESM